MRLALRSLVVTVAGTALAGSAQARGENTLVLREPPAQVRLAPRQAAEASFRPLALVEDRLVLGGELAADERAIFLTQAEALRTTAFRVGYLNAVSNLPEASRILVRINDQTIGEVRLDANATEATAILPLPPGVVAPGYNSVRFIAVQRHRVDCSVKATYELWSSVSLNRSGFVGLPAAPAIRRLADLPALAASGAEQTPIRIRLAETSDTLTIERAMRVANAVILAAGIQRPRITVSDEPGEGPGLDLVIDRAPPAGSIPLENETGLLQVLDQATGRTTLTVRPGREGERTLQHLQETAAANAPTGSVPGRRALSNTAGRQVSDGSSFSFGELGFESRPFEGSFYQSSVRFNLPSDFFPAPYGSALLALSTSFLGEAAPGKRINIRINDQIAAVVPMNQSGSGQLGQQRVDLPIQMFKPGANTVSIEPNLAGADHACDATVARTSPSRLLIDPSSRIGFGSLARITVLPSLSATLTHGQPYLDQDMPATVAVSPANPAYLDAAMTWIGRMTASSRTPVQTNFRFGPLDDFDVSGLFFGPPTEASQTIARRSVIAEQRRPATAEAATPPTDGTDAAERSADAAAQAKAPTLAERLRASATGGALTRIMRGDIEPVAEWMQDFGLIERSTTAKAEGGPALVTADGLTILQEVGQQQGQVWRGLFEQQPAPRVKTMVLAADPDKLEELVSKATSTHFWSRFNGESALVRPESWGPRNLAAQQNHYVPTSHPSPANLRLSIAGWLSLNQGYYVGGLTFLALLLALATAVVLRTRRI